MPLYTSVRKQKVFFHIEIELQLVFLAQQDLIWYVLYLSIFC